MVPLPASFYSLFFFFNDTATTEIYTLSLHDALPISCAWRVPFHRRRSRHESIRRGHGRGSAGGSGSFSRGHFAYRFAAAGNERVGITETRHAAFSGHGRGDADAIRNHRLRGAGHAHGSGGLRHATVSHRRIARAARTGGARQGTEA